MLLHNIAHSFSTEDTKPQASCEPTLHFCYRALPLWNKQKVAVQSIICLCCSDPLESLPYSGKRCSSFLGLRSPCFHSNVLWSQRGSHPIPLELKPTDTLSMDQPAGGVWQSAELFTASPRGTRIPKLHLSAPISWLATHP